MLLTYTCNLECEHCFVWGSPQQSGTMTLRRVREILHQAKETGTVRWIYFEGGEPFLYYPILVEAVSEGAKMGFKVGVLSNCYWATDPEDAAKWLQPFAGLVQDFSVSSDLYHWNVKLSQQAKNACAAAEALGIPVGMISIAQPEDTHAESAMSQLPPGESRVMYRGRAAENLTERADGQPWEKFAECPFENLRNPTRVHVDPFGNLHVCQGVVFGNLFNKPLREICLEYDPESHPIIGPLLEGGPVELTQRYGLQHKETYADPCHLCYETRKSLRERFPEILKPDQMYGVPE